MKAYHPSYAQASDPLTPDGGEGEPLIPTPSPPPGERVATGRVRGLLLTARGLRVPFLGWVHKLGVKPSSSVPLGARANA